MESLQRVMEIANRVNGTASKVEINQHQCSRLAKVFDEVGKSIKLLIMANKEDGQQNPEINALDALLHVFESGELLVLDYAGPNWFRNLVTSRENKEAFEEIYDDLQDILNNLFGIPLDKMHYPLSDDGAQDQKEMARKLTIMKAQQSLIFDTFTTNLETSSELHIQSYSLEIALRKLSQDGNLLYSALPPPGWHDNNDVAASPEVEYWSWNDSPTLEYPTHEETEIDCRRCSGVISSPNLRVTVGDFGIVSRVEASACEATQDDVANYFVAEQTTIEGSAIEEVAVDLRVEPSTIKLGEVLGRGSYSEVRVAEWVNCEFAVKILRASDVRALRREVEIHMKLRHPRIVQLVGFSADEDKCMILMELMDGDLHTHIASQMNVFSRKQPFSLHEAVDLMKQIAMGMEFLHLKGILHGDLKTQNVLLMRKRIGLQLKITDFGVSQEKLVKTLEGVYEASSFSGIVGSGYYRAPEILKATLETEAKYSGKADVYSFAMTAYEILTGLVPFQNKSTTRQSVIDGDRPDLPPKLNSTLKQLLERCWHGEQDVRPSFKEICIDLKSLILSPEVGMHKRWRENFFMRARAKAKPLLPDIMGHVYASYSNVN